MRDPMSADANAQAPDGHPDAQVRVDQRVKLTGVQPIRYDAPLPFGTKRHLPAEQGALTKLPSEAELAALKAEAAKANANRALNTVLEVLQDEQTENLSSDAQEGADHGDQADHE